MPSVTLARNATVAKLVGADRQIVAKVNNLLSYTVEQGLGFSGLSSFYDHQTSSFPAGFVHVVTEELRRAGHTVHLVENPLPVPLGPENPVVDEFGNNDPRYDYQMQALQQVERHGAGIIRVAAGGGKSKVAKLIMQRYNRMTLFLTTRGILLYQMKKQVDDLGIETGIIGDGHMSFVKGANFGMVQTLVMALEETSVDKEYRAIVSAWHLSKKRKKAKKEKEPSRDVMMAQARENFARRDAKRNAIIRFLSMVEVVIGEEAHEAGGNRYYEILRHCKNARVRVALTATPFMRSSAEDNMRLMAAFGPVLIDVSEKLLIDRGILAKPFFLFRNVPPSNILHKSASYERAYKIGYIENANMMKQLLTDAMEAKKRGLPILTLVLRKSHGEMLLDAFNSNGLNFVFLKGDNDQSEREKCLKDLASGQIDGVIGTTILDVGVDVPGIGLVQLAGGGKAEIALRQRIGRGLRSKKKNANVAFIIDYSCNTSITLRQHAKQRKAIIQNTPGFSDNIVEDQLPWWKFDEFDKKSASA